MAVNDAHATHLLALRRPHRDADCGQQVMLVGDGLPFSQSPAYEPSTATEPLSHWQSSADGREVSV